MAHQTRQLRENTVCSRQREIIKYTAKPAVQEHLESLRGRKNRQVRKYHKEFASVLMTIWELFDFQCGKLLAPLISGMMSLLIPEFNLIEVFQTLLQSVSNCGARACGKFYQTLAITDAASGWTEICTLLNNIHR
ncbi:MAG: hypothetical protein LBV17_07350 [Treponema sp.]|jgi:hypothetical protein|nr:hypothetical protein [Treponema sp.]